MRKLILVSMMALALPAAAQDEEGARAAEEAVQEAPEEIEEAAAEAEENLEAAAEAVEAETAPKDRAPPEGYEAVEGPGAAQQELEAPPLVVGAYLFIWGATFAYLLFLWRRQKRVGQELDDLERRIERMEP